MSLSWMRDPSTWAFFHSFPRRIGRELNRKVEQLWLWCPILGWQGGTTIGLVGYTIFFKLLIDVFERKKLCAVSQWTWGRLEQGARNHIVVSHVCAGTPELGLCGLGPSKHSSREVELEAEQQEFEPGIWDAVIANGSFTILLAHVTLAPHVF